MLALVGLASAQARDSTPNSPGGDGRRSGFGMSEIAPEELVAELELAACCGIPPYTPDTLMEIEVSERSVRAFLPAEYALRPAASPRPRGLPSRHGPVAHGAGLGRTVHRARPWPSSMPRFGSWEAVAGSDPWTRWLHLAAVREAARGRRGQVEIDYLSGSRDELTERIVEPIAGVPPSTGIENSTSTATGRATCGGSGSTGSARCSPWSAAPAPARPRGTPSGGDVRAGARRRSRSTRNSGPGAQWVPGVCLCALVSTRLPTASVSDVVLDVAGMAWFERLLLQLGPEVRAVSPPELNRPRGRRGSAASWRLRFVGEADNVAP